MAFEMLRPSALRPPKVFTNLAQLWCAKAPAT
jgi:hypothetical protein